MLNLCRFEEFHLATLIIDPTNVELWMYFQPNKATETLRGTTWLNSEGFCHK